MMSITSLLPGTLPVPNRGKQLFVLIEAHGTHIIAMTPPTRPVIQEWNCCNPTYDFVSAVVQPTSEGSKVSFSRFVMGADYVPRTEYSTRVFPYTNQPRYRFFDAGYITGFYRNSVEDFDAREFLFPKTPNHALQLTAGRRVTTLDFHERVLDIESLGFRQR